MYPPIRTGARTLSNRRREYQTRPDIFLGLQIHKHSNSTTHRLTKQKRRQLCKLITLPNTNKIRQRSSSSFIHITNIPLKAIRATMAKKISSKDSVAPLGVGDADFLEAPAGVGAVAVGHEDGGFDGLGGG
ncbi:hypothetical protein HanRHA438_Chr12g0541691 [Helianthus annuus]|nr:hypothetical protein HanRHA438_Chr12g0541691 [Helianthus annuus]